MNNGLESLKDTKTGLLTTYKRDGTPVDTPVSVAFAGEPLWPGSSSPSARSRIASAGLRADPR